MLTKTDAREIPVPSSSVDISRWLFGLGDDDYRRMAKAHLGLGAFETSDGRRGLFDVEGFPGLLIVNHHREEEARRDYVRVRSGDSRAYVLGLVPVSLEVCWEMAVRPFGSERSEVECRLHIGFPVRALEWLAYLLLVPVVQRRHLREQMTGFVADLLDKYEGRPLGSKGAGPESLPPRG